MKDAEEELEEFLRKKYGRGAGASPDLHL